MASKDSSGIIIQSVDRAIDILMLIGESKEPIPAAEISKQTGINRTTVYGLLHTLERKHFIVRNENSGCYTIGPIAFQLGLSFQKSSSLITAMESKSSWFTDKWNYTARLGIYNGAGKLLLLLIETPHEGPVSFPFYTGMTFPMHATSMGKILLANMQETELALFLRNNPLGRYTNATLQSADALLEELEKIRTLGYCFDRGEFMDGVCCIAAPVFNAYGKVIAAVSLSSSMDNIRASENELIQDVRIMAKHVSFDLGWKP